MLNFTLQVRFQLPSKVFDIGRSHVFISVLFQFPVFQG